MDVERLFWELYRAPVERDVDKILERYRLAENPACWRPYGQNYSNFGVVENQQSSPIPALIEKITNGIDAILMRACIENGIDPRSKGAPRSINEALDRFFPDHKNWDLRRQRRQLAERLQILADGPRRETSLVVYDDGEGQTPDHFEKTFLSLLNGNKNDIHFVQGKYNMGGAGAVVFCGRRRYQLIASKRFDGGDKLGFTLVRRHPLTADEEKHRKATWYEYLVLGDLIPAFACGPLDLGLHNRDFTTGTAIKLYSYDLPIGSRSVISRDLNQSINEYLFNPALPIFTIDTPKRYPDDRNLARDLHGLKQRLEEDDSRYVDQFFSEDVIDREIGRIRVTCYVFKPRVDRRTVKETRETIRREFFKNNMSVLFSVNGQVHGHYTSEFITRSLKFPLLRDYLLVHVDCAALHTEFRNELFMASRDRLKDGKESGSLRRKLTGLLADGRLKEVHKERKASITVESGDTEELLRSLTRNLPIRDELADLLGQTFKLGDERDGKRKEKTRNAPRKEPEGKFSFSAKRYPSYFRIDAKPVDDEVFPMVQVPIGGERTIRFSTDVEDQYFDRLQDAGDLQIGLLEPISNETGGGDRSGLPRSVETVFNVARSSPRNGTIRVVMKPTGETKVGDHIKLQASLSSPEGSLEQIFMVRIGEPERKNTNPKKDGRPDNRLGLPQLHMVYKDASRGKPTWDSLEGSGIPMEHGIVVHPLVEGDALSAVYINMDSHALLSHRAKLTKEEAIATAEKRYVSAVYFHTLFLYTITKNRKFGIIQYGEEDSKKDVEIAEYISDLFSTFYAQFLLNFDTQELIAALEA